ncbi:MAG: DNA-directed RNA polymerase subunit H [Thermoplasmatales archaeon]|jgi:DNA-directed RNA polymerase subunit H (RpoH/RPB5)|nr:DNA-directed RNA polymerase subunit H [Candidatus Thermoplasmatota archaeon]MCL6002620.1 DNA-directed RNA polymerase subunit H [Candidatus Thermoplasmatota archaeon]MDA8054448.1 DNA-directed RNA polymerase subunit H [Thermoplasmatales archaeon]
MAKYNILVHEMVPEHWLIPVKEEEKILKSLGVTKGQLPKIRKSDPVIKTLEKVKGEIEPGRIIEIVRKSRTSGIAKIYRTVMGE